MALHLERSKPVIRLNLAGHGGEPAPGPLSFDSLADHVAGALAEAGIERCHLIGHSLGGKVAMTLAGRALERDPQANGLSIESLIVLDIAPKHYDEHHRSILDALQAVDITNLATRADADTALRKSIPHAGTRAFLLKSLARQGDGWGWQFALERLAADYADLTIPPPFVDPGDGAQQPPVLFVRGTDSDYLMDDDVLLVRRYFPRAQFRAVKASHWLHAEKPAQVAELCESFVKKANT